MLSESDRNLLARRFERGMIEDVSLLVFSDPDGGPSHEVVEFATALSSLSPKIKMETETVVQGKNQRMRDMRIENWPCTVLRKGDFARIRYYGLPGGYETPALVDGLIELSSSKTALSPKAKDAVSKIRRKANIKVFVLTTCPFCPLVARHSYRAAIESPMVTAEIIDSSTFPELAARHSVMGVPKIILNDSMDITGALDEGAFFEKLRDADTAVLDSMFG